MFRQTRAETLATQASNMALKQQYVTDAKTVMWKDCEKLVQRLHACLVEGNAMERNNKKDGLPVRGI